MSIVISPTTLTVQDEGTTQGAANILNFTGGTVVASVSGSTATINVTGGGGFSATETELDFGSNPVTDATFTVTDAAITAASKIMCVESGNVATGRVGADSLWDSINYSALGASGSFTLYARASGAVVGKRKMFYAYS